MRVTHKSDNLLTCGLCVNKIHNNIDKNYKQKYVYMYYVIQVYFAWLKRALKMQSTVTI